MLEAQAIYFSDVSRPENYVYQFIAVDCCLFNYCMLAKIVRGAKIVNHKVLKLTKSQKFVTCKILP